MEQEELVLLHLSDLHFGLDRTKDERASRKIVLDGLLNYIESLGESYSPNIVCITGDIIYKGEKQAYSTASVWLDELIDRFRLEPSNLIFCPGNHELDIKYKLSLPSDATEADKKLNYPFSSQIIKPFKGFISFCEKQKIPPLDLGENYSNYLVGKRSIDFIDFYVFNSAWFCQGESSEGGKLWLGEKFLKQLGAYNDFYASRKDRIKISLLHHQARHLHEGETRPPTLSENRPAVFDQLTKQSNIILNGHMHSGPASNTQIDDAFIFESGATYNGIDHHNNVSIYRISPSKFEKTDITFIPNQQQWIKGTTTQKAFSSSCLLGNELPESYIIPPKVQKQIPHLDTYKSHILSKYPLKYIDLTLPLIGRDNPLKILKEKSEDTLICGEAGTGKSFLVYSLLKNTKGYFITSSVPDNVIAVIRDNLADINTIAVDDISNRFEIISRLIQFRNEFGANFRILTTCLPSEALEFSAINNSFYRNKIVLKPVPRKLIINLINSMSIGGPDWLIYELIAQAHGFPAIAAFLCKELLSENYEGVKTGKSLYKYYMGVLKNKINHDAKLFLAVSATAGTLGMSIDNICTFLGIGKHKALHAIDALNSSGIIINYQSSSFSIGPKQFACAIILNSFFSNNSIFTFGDYQKIFDLIPNKYSAFDLLLELKNRSDVVPDWYLREKIILQWLEDKAPFWERLGYSSVSNAEWIFCNHPEKIMMAAKSLLHRIPYRTIPFMLTKATGDERPLHSNLDHPLRIIEEWLKEASSIKKDYIEPRKILLNAALDWNKNNNNSDSMILKVAELVFSLKYVACNQSLEDKKTFIFRNGIISFKYAQAIFNELWPVFINYLHQMGEVSDYKSLYSMIRQWLQPEILYPNNKVKNSRRYTAIGKRMLKNCIPYISLGGQSVLLELANIHKIKTSVMIDQDFTMLYPEREHYDDFDKQKDIWNNNVKNISNKWMKLPINQVVSKIVLYENEALKNEHNWPKLINWVCNQIAQNDNDRRWEWLQALFKEKCCSDILFPFIEQIHNNISQDELQLFLKACLDNKQYQWIVLAYSLFSTHISEDFFIKLIPNYQDMPKVIVHGCYDRTVPLLRMQRLLESNSKEIVVAAVIREFNNKENNSTRKAIYDLWRNSVISYLHSAPRTDFYYFDFEKILAQDGALPYDWLIKHVEKDITNIQIWDRENIPYSKICKKISPEQRLEIISKLPDYLCHNETLVRALIGNNEVLFLELLKTQENKSIRLIPLKGSPTSLDWQKLALVAYDFGIESTQIANAIIGSCYGWSGEQSEFMQSKINDFHNLANNSSGKLLQIAQAGIELFESKKASTIELEKEENFIR